MATKYVLSLRDEEGKPVSNVTVSVGLGSPTYNFTARTNGRYSIAAIPDDNDYDLFIDGVQVPNVKITVNNE